MYTALTLTVYYFFGSISFFDLLIGSTLAEVGSEISAFFFDRNEAKFIVFFLDPFTSVFSSFSAFLTMDSSSSQQV